MKISVGLQEIAWGLRDLVAGNDLNVAIEPRASIVCTIATGAQHLAALKRSIEKGIVATERNPTIRAAQADLGALATSLAVIYKVPETGLLRGDKENIVGVLRSEPTGMPIQFALACAADTSLKVPRYDLLQRRICNESVWQVARLGRIRAAKFDGRSGDG